MPAAGFPARGSQDWLPHSFFTTVAFRTQRSCLPPATLRPRFVGLRPTVALSAGPFGLNRTEVFRCLLSITASQTQTLLIVFYRVNPVSDFVVRPSKVEKRCCGQFAVSPQRRKRDTQRPVRLTIASLIHRGPPDDPARAP